MSSFVSMMAQLMLTAGVLAVLLVGTAFVLGSLSRISRQ